MIPVLALAEASADALASRAQALARALESDPRPDLRALCDRESPGQGPYRAALVALEAQKVVAELRALVPERAAERPAVAFMFTGQGSQYAGMGAELMTASGVFRDFFLRCAARVGGSLADIVHPRDGAATPIDDTGFAQPAIYSIECALVELLRSFAVQPTHVLGHSVGEYAAAYAAGVFSLEDGAQLIAARGQAMQALPREGTMVAILASEAVVAPHVAPHSARVALAALNGKENTVISGDRDLVLGIAKTLGEQGVRSQELRVSHAFHSPLMQPMLETFSAAAAQIVYQKPKLALVSNLTGTVLERAPDAGYWREHVMSPVRFAAGIEAIVAQGVELCVEVGPQPVLIGMARRVVSSPKMAWLPTLRKGGELWPRLAETLATLYARGVDVDWSAWRSLKA